MTTSAGVSPYVQNFGITTVAASTTITAEAHAGKMLVVTAAAGATLTLPAATGSGVRFTVINTTDQTGDLVIQVPDAANIMVGVALTDMSGVIWPTAATTDTITLNGTTTGGKAGTRATLTDIAANTWHVEVVGEASGTEETPFSAAVS